MSAVMMRVASEADAAEIAALVNRAYRPAAESGGWTHEAAWVAGARTSATMVERLFRPGSAVLVLCRGGAIVACVNVEAIPAPAGAAAYIGMLATEPAAQAAGLGKRMLACAEQYAVAEFGARAFRMTVLTSRPELIAFYERRGYVRSGVVEDFPVAAGYGLPRVDGLRLETLVKALGA